MKVLAIDTSSIVATVAIIDEEKILCEYVLNHKKTHSQKLMPIIEHTLNSTELKISDIDIFAVVIGPGSFTGLRIGVSTAKTLAHSTDKPIVGVSTLDALAYGIPYYNGIICPIIDAKNNQVYTAFYKWKNNFMERITEYMVVDIEEVVQRIKNENEGVIFLGDGVYSYRDILLHKLEKLVKFSPIHSIMPRASLAAELALLKYRSGHYDDYMTLSPLYLRKSQAERLLKNN